jgi:4-hydroxy-tetrahydrodipicolinate synthase/2-dehydro-3-deoxy-D-gluconate aldolase
MKFKGIITPMVTPFTPSGDIDYPATEELLAYLKSIGVHGLFPLGSTGVFNWLSNEERKKFAEFVIEHSAGMKVFVGVGASNSYDSIKLSKHAADAGADALVLMPSYYIKSDQDYIRNHMDLVFGSVDSHFIIYNIPQFVGEFIGVETIETLIAKHSNIVGLKESSGDMRYFSRLVRFSGKDFSVFQGQDDLLLPSLAIGADGGVCGTTNFSRSVMDLYKAFLDGNMKECRSIQMEGVNGLMDQLSKSTFPEAYYAAFYLKHSIRGGFRVPMQGPSPEIIESLREKLITARS